MGGYGTADGSHSASYIIGKLYDVAEAHPTDNIVKVCSCRLAYIAFFCVQKLAYVSLINCLGIFLPRIFFHEYVFSTYISVNSLIVSSKEVYVGMAIKIASSLYSNPSRVFIQEKEK